MASLNWEEKAQAWRVHVRITGKQRIRRSKMLPRGLSREEAEKYAELFERKILGEAYELPTNHDWIQRVEFAIATPKSWFHRMIGNAKKRGRNRGHEHELTADELRTICLRCEGKCEVSGIAFSDERNNARRLRPLVPTLDRIDSTKGYSFANCRLVCGAVNVAMFDWGEGMFLQIVAGTFYNRFIQPTFGEYQPINAPLQGEQRVMSPLL